MALLLILILTIVWMMLSPMTVVNKENSRVLLEYHPDIYIAYYRFGCSLDLNVDNRGFIFTLICLFLVFLVNSLRIAFVANKVLLQLVPDINMLRVTLYVMATISLAGGLVTWIMFSKESHQIVTATSILNILIVTMTTVLQAFHLF